MTDIDLSGFLIAAVPGSLTLKTQCMRCDWEMTHAHARLQLIAETCAQHPCRGELEELRTILAKAENDQCGCLGGPLTIEWARGL